MLTFLENDLRIVHSDEHRHKTQELEKICNILLQNRLLIVPTSSFPLCFSDLCLPFQLSSSRSVDLCPFYAACCLHGLVEDHLMDHGYLQNTAYLSRLLIQMVEIWRQRFKWFTSDTMDDIVALIRRGAEVNCVNSINYVEEYCPIIDTVSFLLNGQESQDEIDSKCQILLDNGADFAIGVLPLCTAVFDCVLPLSAHSSAVWGIFTPHDLLALSKGRLIDKNSGRSRIFVIFNKTDDSEQLYAVDVKASEVMLDLLSSIATKSLIDNSSSLSYRPGAILISHPMQLSPQIKSQICRLSSLADALRYMGKTETAIQNSARMYLQSLRSIRGNRWAAYERIYTDPDIDECEERIWGPQNQIEIVDESHLSSEGGQVPWSSRLVNEERSMNELSVEESEEL